MAHPVYSLPSVEQAKETLKFNQLVYDGILVDAYIIRFDKDVEAWVTLLVNGYQMDTQKSYVRIVGPELQ